MMCWGRRPEASARSCTKLHGIEILAARNCTELHGIETLVARSCTELHGVARNLASLICWFVIASVDV